MVYSGASQHMCKERNMFCSFIELNETKYIKIEDGTTLREEGQGYRVYYEKENKVAIGREIIFELDKPVEQNSEEKFVSLDIEVTECREEDSDVKNSENLEEISESNLNETKNENSQNEENVDEPINPSPSRVRDERLRPFRALKRPTHLHTDYDLSFFSLDVDEPTSYSDAMESKYKSVSGKKQ
ncbi:hypothetical protein WA026_014114 [Henosepilachna vigintioctopunctata]|uniref:Retrovirus-related Pol polyprotein from transposon TNT 1-94-like beta-barrel domain-containing protein n=1 Tax=Henosepilachna vigintioctopunctata TaxID=420089 RepID=A0AAW1TVB4_9CUCU